MVIELLLLLRRGSARYSSQFFRCTIEPDVSEPSMPIASCEVFRAWKNGTSVRRASRIRGNLERRANL